MKKMNNKRMVALLMCFVAATGCKKLDINENPNSLSVDKGTPESLFPSAVLSAVGRIDGELGVVGGMWAQFWAQAAASSQYKDLDSYNISSQTAYLNRSYSELYTGALFDLQSIIRKAKDSKDWRFYLMATAMKAYTYEVLVDLYDKVPYTEALQGDRFLQPKFDDGYTVYKSLLAEIDEALLHDFTTEPFLPGQTKVDFVFGEKGNADFEEQMLNWKKFANTLKLKMYLRMVNVKPAEAEAGIRAMMDAETEFLTEGAGVTTFQDIPDAGNPMYEFNVRRLNTQTNLRASYTLGSFLKAHNDPRIAAYYGSVSPKLMHQGDYGTNTVEVQTAAVAVQKATDPAWLFAKPECYFLQAEADARYNGGADAENLYNKGVVASFVERGYSEEQANQLLGGAYAYPSAGTLEQKIEAIITQKWASLFGPHALEAFFDKTRTGYPKTSPVYSKEVGYIPGQLVVVPQSAIGQNLPKRFLFPDFERSRNTNTPMEIPLSTPVWWGK